ncbi:MAG: ABC transporter permease [Tumebacillaceae bacterium]
MSTVAKNLRFMWHCWKLNLAGAMEFRMSFLMTAGMMFLNNTVWIFFWGVYFTRFPLVNGWEMSDVMLMWAVGAGGFGLSASLFGNAYRIANVVSTGQLDTCLAQPKPVLLHVLVSRMNVSAIGDLVFAVLLFVIYGDKSPMGILRSVVALLLSMLIFTFFNVLAQSLAFYIGNAEGLGHQFFITFITFATYPTDIFRGLGRMILFTIIPAGFISFMPIGILKSIHAGYVWGLIAATVILIIGGTWVFHQGLKRYGSGNMLTVRM